MTALAQPIAGSSLGRRMLNKVPEVTVYFWVIKVLCTTVGETAADYMSDTLGFGLTKTTYVMSAVLIASLIVQFAFRKYVPFVYWLAVVLISIVGTLITDNLVDNYGVALETTTIAFSIALAATFAAWYASERTLSIHTIYTTRRESFYWLAVLFTFALGTAAGDLMAERLGLGYFVSLLIFAGMIGIVALAHFRFRLNAILSFWIAYILTRPLGASIGDWMSQKTKHGGLGLGTTTTSMVFLGTILALVIFLTVTRRDRIEATRPSHADRVADGRPSILVVFNRTDATAAIIDAIRARAAAGPARFFVLVPNPAHLGFDRISPEHGRGDETLQQTLSALAEPAGTEVGGRVANSPNAYDDIVEELDENGYDEIILETPPAHFSHWLHVDLPQRIADLGYPLTAVAATN